MLVGGSVSAGDVIILIGMCIVIITSFDNVFSLFIYLILFKLFGLFIYFILAYVFN